jgi:hypothetical protein
MNDNPPMRARPSFVLPLLLWPLAVLAQAPDASADRRPNQKIERIVTEDSANRIEELRVGGQLQSVTVQPKGEAPAYEMQPSDLARSRPADRREGLSGGGSQRVWNVLNF